MIRRISFALLTVMFAALLFACRPSHPPQDGAKAVNAQAPSYATLPPEALGVKAYRGEGRVVRIEPDGDHVTIAHHTIPGFMSAMTMSFRVRDKQMLAGLRPGDEVEFTLEVGATSAMLTAIRKKR
jgi:protein SCO1